jgi:hypothetical protein
LASIADNPVGICELGASGFLATSTMTGAAIGSGAFLAYSVMEAAAGSSLFSTLASGC